MSHGHRRKLFQRRLAGGVQKSCAGQIGVGSVELPKSIGEEEEDQALTDWTKRHWINGVWATSPYPRKLGNAMKTPRAFRILLQSPWNYRPQLAARTLVNSALARVGRRNGKGTIPVQFRKAGIIHMADQDLAMR